VDGTIHPAPSCQCRIGSIPDGFDVLLGDIALNDF
jgi:hypothetical protein